MDRTRQSINRCFDRRLPISLGMPWEYRVINEPDGTFSVEGFLRDRSEQRYRSASGLRHRSGGSAVGV